MNKILCRVTEPSSKEDLDAAWKVWKARVLAELRMTDQESKEYRARLWLTSNRCLDLDAMEEAREGWVDFPGDNS